VLNNKTFRVFVSSTFSDLKEERNALQREVFPKLRELCMEHGFRFQAIDLRWGVSEEAGLDQQTMKICLEEIERSQRVSPKPNFIVLLGDRYGWRPLPYEIPADEFEEILDKVPEKDKPFLSWKGDLLDDEQLKKREGWYCLDTNAVPSVYCLKPRLVDYDENDPDDVIKEAKDKESEDWGKIEERIKTLLLKAIEELEWPENDPRRSKYEDSATEQEIMKGVLKPPKDIPHPEEHVFCFFRNIKEKEKLGLNDYTKDFFDFNNEGKLDESSTESLNKLKEKLKKKLVHSNNNSNIFNYYTEWQGDTLSENHLRDLCNDAYDSLSSVILEEINKFKNVDPVSAEIKEHENYSKQFNKVFIGRKTVINHMEEFIGRETVINQIDEYTHGASESCLIISGAPGSGKTAILVEIARRTKIKYQNAVVISRFIGATPSSHNIQFLLYSIIKEIKNEYGEEDGLTYSETDLVASSADHSKRNIDFSWSLLSASKEKPLIILIDSLNQLNDSEDFKTFSWLDSRWPKDVYLILTTTPDHLSKSSYLMKINELKIPDMDHEEGVDLLNTWLNNAERRLKKNQKDIILQRFSKNRFPLYLKIAFEESKKWKSYHEDVILNPNLKGIISDMLSRISLESNHGKIMVEKSISYLTTSRNGLTEDELIDLLSNDKEVLNDFYRRSPLSPKVERLPLVIWSRLYFDLDAYIRSNNIGGYNLYYFPGTIKEIIKDQFIENETEIKFHQIHVKYFKKSNLDDRKIDELPWHLEKLKLYEELKNFITGIIVFSKMASVPRQSELIHYWNSLKPNYDLANEIMENLTGYEQEGLSPNITDTYDDMACFFNIVAEYNYAEILFKRELTILEKELGPENPKIVDIKQNLAFTLMKSGSIDSSESIIKNVLKTPKDNSGDEIVKSLNLKGLVLYEKGEHDEAEQTFRLAIKKSEEYRTNNYNILNNLGIVLELKGNFEEAEKLYTDSLKLCEVVYGKDDPEVAARLNNLALLLSKKEELERAEELYRRSLKIRQEKLGLEHPDTAQSLGNLALLLTQKGSFEEAEELYMKSITIYEKTLGPDHKSTLLFKNNLAILLNIKNSNSLNNSYDESKTYETDSFSSDSKTDNSPDTVRAGDLETGKNLKTLKGHTDTVWAVAVTPDGKKAVSGSWDKTVCVWDLETGKILKTKKGHSNMVNVVVVTPDGKKAIIGSGDESVRVWDLETGKILKTLEGLSENVGAVVVTPDGKKAVAGSYKTVCVWDLETGKILKTLEGHPNTVFAVAVTPDGKKVLIGGGSLTGIDNIIRVWDLETGKKFHTLKGHTDIVYAVVVTPDGKKAVTGSDDKTIRLWDIETGDLISFYKEKSEIYCLAMKDDENFVFGSGSGDVVLSHLINISKSFPLITSKKMWVYGENDNYTTMWFSGDSGYWDENITADCPCCGERFKVSDEIIDMIRETEKQYKMPNGWISDEAWNDTRLISECRECNQKIKFNPFIVDNSEEEIK
ncbi:MAG: WD40 repeat-containing protein, partial [Methanobacterium sp. Maddingley MBC34]